MLKMKLIDWLLVVYAVFNPLRIDYLVQTGLMGRKYGKEKEQSGTKSKLLFIFY